MLSIIMILIFLNTHADATELNNITFRKDIGLSDTVSLLPLTDVVLDGVVGHIVQDMGTMCN